MNKVKLLLVEDELTLAQIIKESLETRDFVVIHAQNGEEALQMYQQNSPDILVVDIMMPVKDGLTLTKEIRSIDSQTPIIFLTAKSQPQDVVTGFDTGGNDYLKKPFSIEELIARIKNLVNRKPGHDNMHELILGEYKFNPNNQTLQFKEDQIDTLTSRESQLLLFLAQNRNQIVERNTVLDLMWTNNDFYSSRSMDVFISKLRKLLSKDKTLKILNVRGIGYKLVV
ncbi:response regulator transcription factor [uncultured Christiangramia sp.]|jgi:DNA-binding response OmpR family regulator|uniref:response regulator transcription factor n=1 Tax=Christiangramia sp. 3-2217-3z TaxID=3417564 RepID=UPI0026263AEB|nr:response regulator transcription factor [uncultured Christiangramia sp.]